MECDVCGGELAYLGTLGNVDWFGCRACGTIVMIKIEDEE